MTRINLTEPSELYDQHLVAEYREITRVPNYLRKTLSRRKPFCPEKEIPSQFVLGKGHVKFFYNKLLFLARRYHLLRQEMMARGMQPDPQRAFPPIKGFPNWTKNNWVPTAEERSLSERRLQEKVQQKPNWYRKTELKKMIEIELLITCDECGEDVTMDETELQEIVNFGPTLVGCWGLPPEDLPNGFEWNEADELMLCENCAQSKQKDDE